MAEAEKQRERMLRTVERRSEAMLRETEGALRTLIAELETGLNRQAGMVEISKWQALKSRTSAARTVSDVLEKWLAEEYRRWERSTLVPLIELQWQSLMEDIDDQAEEFLANLELIKTELKLNIAPKAADENQLGSALSRMFGAGVGLVLFGPGAALEGASVGIAKMGKGLAINFAAVVGLTLAGATLPFIYPALIALGVLRTFASAQSTIDEIRKSVADKISGELRAAAPGIESGLRQQVEAATKPFASKVNERMTTMVDEIRGQVQSVIRDRERQQQTSEQQLAEVAAVRSVMTDQQQQLHAISASMRL